MSMIFFMLCFFCECTRRRNVENGRNSHSSVWHCWIGSGSLYSQTDEITLFWATCCLGRMGRLTPRTRAFRLGGFASCRRRRRSASSRLTSCLSRLEADPSLGRIGVSPRRARRAGVDDKNALFRVNYVTLVHNGIGIRDQYKSACD